VYLKVIYVWCTKDMVEKVVGEENEEVVITHSFCLECKARIEEEINDFITNSEHTEE
jgi:hypothetical protein